MKNLVARGIGALKVPEKRLSNGFKVYFHSLNTGLLYDDKIEELVARKEAGDLEARNELVSCYMKYVIAAVHRYFNPELPIDDFEELIAIGNEALIGLVDKSVHRKRETFDTCMKSAIYNRIRIAARLQSEEKGELQRLNPFIRAENDPESNTMHTIFVDNIEKILSTLTEKERRVLKLRFGFETGEILTLEETGKAIGATRERVRQIEAKALRKLRHPSRSRKVGWYLY
ncbi:MAG: sigma-70 family RNA polymerase sigma factor [Ignavibacteriales bacterium]